MKLKTKLTKLGRNFRKNKGFVNPGIYKGSTIIFENYRQYLNDRDSLDGSHSLYYGIHNNPLCNKFEKTISSLYESADTVTVSSGLTAVIIPLLTFLKPGDHILVTDSLYNPTRIFCNNILNQYGIKVEYFHPNIRINKLESLIKKNTKIIFLESPGTATFDIMDIPNIAKIAKKNNVITIADNTWASVIFSNPLKLGVNIVVEAITKYISGHSDILLGIIVSDKKHAKSIRNQTKNMGICVGSEEVYLSLRGIPTLELRMKQIEKNNLLLAKELEKNNKVKKVFHPGLRSHYNYNIWKRDFNGSAGLFSIELKKMHSNKKIENFYNKLKIFKLGYSFGGFESLITFPNLKNRTKKYNINGNLIRIYCGLEDYEDQKNDMINALKEL